MTRTIHQIVDDEISQLLAPVSAASAPSAVKPVSGPAAIQLRAVAPAFIKNGREYLLYCRVDNDEQWHVMKADRYDDGCIHFTNIHRTGFDLDAHTTVYELPSLIQQEE